MRSIFAKILLWFAATLIVCLAATTLIAFHHRFAPGRRDFFSRSLAFQVNGSEAAYQTGGVEGLQRYFANLQRYFPGSYELLDRSGNDVVTGAERGDLMRQERHHRWRMGGRDVLVWPSRDRQYRMVVDSVIPPGPWSPWTSYLWVLGGMVLFSYVLAVYLAAPVRKLAHVVERFGSGDLAVRADSRRRDEFGDLAAAFNVMADRTETLLTAERRLLQDVSHELRSPLARLQFAVELAQTSPDRDQSFARIRKEIDRLSKLVSELLLVTRAESDPGSRELSEVALEGLLRDVAEDSSVEAQAAGCELRVAAKESALVTGNEELLRRAFENVLRNAVRFAPEGTAVDVRLEMQAGTASVTVRDYGPGAPDEALQELCKPFFRVETDRNRNSGGGVGLGLAIAERAIKVHGGEMHVKNAHPGLMVTMELPTAVPNSVTPVS